MAGQRGGDRDRHRAPCARLTPPPDLPLPGDWSRRRLLLGSLAAWLVVTAAAWRHLLVWGGDAAWLLHLGEGTALAAFALLAGFVFLRVVRQASSLPLSFLLAGGIACTALATAVPPFLSSDVFDYVSRGRVEVLGFNPYTTTVDAVANEPGFGAYREHSQWTHWKMPYGPLQALLQWLFAQGESPWFAVCAWKVMSALAHVGTALLLFATMRALHGERDARRGLVLWLWNPWILLEACSMGHNDVLAGVLIAVALYGVATGATVRGTAAFGGALLIKHGPAPFGPLLLAHALANGRVARFLGGVAISAAFAAYWFWRYFRDEGALDFIRKQTEIERASPSSLASMAFGPWAGATVVVFGALLMLVWLSLGWRRAKDPTAVGRFGALALATFVLFCIPAFTPWYQLWWLPMLALANAPTLARATELLAFLGPLSYLVFATTRTLDLGHQVVQLLLAGVWPTLLVLLDWRGIAAMPRRLAASGAAGDDDHRH
jgi:hypothetical protein